MTVALPCLGLDGMGNGLEIRWDGSHLSLAYDTDTQSIPALLSAHGKDVAANFCIGPMVGIWNCVGHIIVKHCHDVTHWPHVHSANYHEYFVAGPPCGAKAIVSCGAL